MDKNFYHSLYSNETVPDIIESYCDCLLKSDNPIVRLKAERLSNYWGLLTDKAFFEKRIPKIFYKMKKEVFGLYPNLTYELIGRIKDLISTFNKASVIEENAINSIKYEFAYNLLKEKNLSDEKLEKAIMEMIKELNSKTHSPLKESFSKFITEYKPEKNPFDRMRDFFAFRVIIEDAEGENLIDELYKVTNTLMDFFNYKTSFVIVRSHPLVQTGELQIDKNLIQIPPTSKIKEIYKDYVKDYVFSPKIDGYQSIHFLVHDPYTERYIEIQLRTRSMDIIAETLANHYKYKKSKYGKQISEIGEKIQYEKIKVKGFRYFKFTDPETGKTAEYISDKAGITKPIPVRLEYDNFFTF